MSLLARPVLRLKRDLRDNSRKIAICGPINLRTCVYSRYAKLKSIAVPAFPLNNSDHGLDLDEPRKHNQLISLQRRLMPGVAGLIK